MGSNFSCTPEDLEEHSIHAAAAFNPQSTMRIVSSETFNAKECVYIPIQFTPSPSPNVMKKMKKAKKRLPKNIQVRTLEPVISGESWDSFGEVSYRSSSQALEHIVTPREEAMTRCASDRQRFLRIKTTEKRLSVPFQLLRKQLEQVRLSTANVQSLPIFLPTLTRDSTDRSGMETPISEIYIMDTTRSRPGWASVSATPDRSLPSFNSFGTWQEDNKMMHKRISQILTVDRSDSQFAIPVPMLTPIFSNKVHRFANEDEERCSMIVDKLERTFQQLPHISSSSSDSGSPMTGSPIPLFIGGTHFPISPKPVHQSSIGGGVFPMSPSSQIPGAGWRVVASLERTRMLASQIQAAPQLLDQMAKELEELSMKYASMMRQKRSPITVR